MKKSIAEIMQQFPHSIGQEIELKRAEEQMKKFQIRHLPVLAGGKVVGILSDRDVKLAVKFGDGLTVQDVMTSDPYVVSPDTLVTEVFGQMAEHKYGAVLIAEKAKVVGIFTAVDAFKLLSEIYR
jgi:acetoin utilization protein AcuB